MKLAELDPRWYVLEENGPKVGLTFECPHCRKERLGIAFHHQGHEAIEDAYIRAHSDQGNNHNYIWTESGEDISNVTITPSIDASASGHWHGWITNGEIR